MEIWDMFKLEKDRNKKKFLDYLNELLDAKDFENLFRAVKVSGVYISYDFRSIDKKQTEKVTMFLLQNLYTIIPEKVNRLLMELHVLTNLKKKVFKKVNDIYALLPKDKQPYYLAQYINNYFVERMNPLLHEQSNSSDLSDLNETVIMCFGMILKDMDRREMLFTVTNEITKHDSYLIGKHIEIASELRAINDIIETWMFSEIEIIKDIENELIQIDEIGDFGKNKLMCQIPFLDLKEAKNAITNFFSFLYFENTELYFSLERDALENKIYEYFYTKDFSQTYKNIPLIDWINSYWCLYEYSLRLVLAPEQKSNIICHSIEEWHAIFLNSGVSQNYVNSLLKHLTFSQKSKDLYDSPLIPFSEGLICIPNMIPFIDISQSLMSQFGIDEDKQSTQINQKGTNFEEHIKFLTEKNIVPTITNLKRNIKNEPYEIDLIFNLDENLFFIEAKTQKQPGSHRDFYRNQEELNMYIKKFNRNVDYFINTENEKLNIMNRLNMKIIKKVYKIFVTNVYEPHHFLNDVYITDEINYFCYMNRQSPSINYINNSDKQATSINVDSNLYTGTMSTYQFLSMINNRNLNERLAKRIGTRIVNLKKQQNLISSCYYIEIPAHQYYDSSISDQEMMDNIKNSYL